MFRILVTISLRNLWAHKTGSLIVGSIIFFGTFLVVLGTSMLDSVNKSMARSITSSIAGHLQIYSATARDDLVLFGGFIGGNDYGVIDNFKPVRDALEALPNVKAVVPMGIQSSLVLQGNEIDLTLNSLRAAVQSGDKEMIQNLRRKLMNISEELIADLNNRLPIAADREKIEEGLSDLDRMRSDAFWEELKGAKERQLLYLETNIAPLAEDGRMYWLRNLGTDVHRFAKLFDRFEVVDGQMIPEGKRGILFSKRFYERRVKARVARELDRAHRNFVDLSKTFAKDPVLEDVSSRLPRQYAGIKNALSATDAAVLSDELKTLMPTVEGDLAEQLKAFLTVNDDNFLQRYEFFYDTIAPKIRLYGLPVGGEFTVRSVTKAGYMKAVKIKVWGTYRFSSLEESDLAGAQNLIDMLTFRELYGVMSEDTKKELAHIKAEVAVQRVDRESAEEALFGGADEDEDENENEEVASAFFDDDAPLEVADGMDDRPYGQLEIDSGITINAAVVLEDDQKLLQTKALIEKISEEKGLGLKVIDWQAAAGIIGRFIYLLQALLLIAIIIIFVVAMVIINNSMVMATLERTPEIGTMRAIGAQRRFIVRMLLLEATVLGLIAGSLGAAAGAGLVMFMGKVGLPAFNEKLIFLFSGPRLYPDVGMTNLIFGFVAVLLVSLASTLYPALIAARIQPVVAMQTKE